MNKKFLIALLFSVVAVVDIAAHSHKCCVGAYCKMKQCDASCPVDCDEDHEEDCDECDDEDCQD